MSHTTPPDQPTPGSLAGRAIQPRFGELAQHCRQLLLSHLDQQLARTFEQIDDALFAQARLASSNLEQALFFDGMRSVREQRMAITRAFLQRLAQAFSAYLESRHTTAAPARAGQPLTLLAHEEHEEKLLLSQMAKRCREQCRGQLDELGRRLPALCRAPQHARGHDIPCSPGSIAEAFQHALPREHLPLQIRRTLYECLEQQLLGELPQLYADLNQRLSEAGIQPLADQRTPPPARNGTTESTDAAAAPSDDTAPS